MRVFSVFILFVLLNAPISTTDVTCNRLFSNGIFDLYTSVGNTISFAAFTSAIHGFRHLTNEHTINDSLLTIIDYSLPSSKKRLLLLDIKNKKALVNCFVAHGMASGKLMATEFSNNTESHKSSLGFYVTGKSYAGKHGYALRLNGLENGFNNNAYKRAIVIHGASYACASFIKSNGYLGRSFGCPAIPIAYNLQLIELIQGSSLVFVYGNNAQYLNNSKVLNSDKM